MTYVKQHDLVTVRGKSGLRLVFHATQGFAGLCHLYSRSHFWPVAVPVAN